MPPWCPRVGTRRPTDCRQSGGRAGPSSSTSSTSTHFPSLMRTTHGSAPLRATLRRATGKADGARDRCMTTRWSRCRGGMHAHSRQWAGKSLPSALQWEKAALGTTGTVFSWGDQKTAAKCNVRETGVGTTTSVFRYHSGVSPYGVYDMVGNVWEWCSTNTHQRPIRAQGHRLHKSRCFEVNQLPGTMQTTSSRTTTPASDAHAPLPR